MSPNKAPSAGGKVTLGANAPVTHESTGTVDPSSLAASSIRHGGGFSENPRSSDSPPGQPASSAEYHSSLTGSSTTGTGSTSNSASLESAQTSQSSQSERGQKGLQSKSTKTEESKIVSPEGQGGKAPSYVENLIHSGAETGGRPHGKNLTEGGFEGSGTAEGALPEPGSENDPGRAAFRRLAGASGGGSNMSKGVTGSAGRKGFAELGSEQSA